MRALTFLLLASLFLPFPAVAKEPIRTIYGTVTKVADGDTITVDAGGTKVKVRLYGIDAPETEKRSKKTGIINKPGQPYGEDAYRVLTEKVSGQRVRLEVVDVDKYRRAVSLVWVGKRLVNLELVREGRAWAYRKYLGRAYASEFIGAEEEARQARRGLWVQSNPQPPWEFRKAMKDRPI